MSEAKHTPGLWVLRGEDVRDSDGVCIVTNGKRSVSALGKFGYAERQKVDAANLALIAAAPELLEALKTAEELLADICVNGETPELANIRAAIAKAEGKGC